MFQFKAGSTSKTIYVKLVDSTTFLAKTGLLYSDMTIFYTLAGATAVTASPATLAAANSAWATGGFILVDDTKTPGLYRFDVPNAAIASGPFSIITFKATNVKDEAVLINLPAYDPYNATTLGLTNLDVASSTLATAANLALVKAKTDNLPADPASAATVATAITGVPAAVLSAATAAPIKAELKKINGVTVNGDGGATPWGP